MNYRNAALSEFKTLANETEDYIENEVKKTLTVGQLFLSVIKNKPEDVDLNDWLMNTSDEDMYTTIEKSKLKERP
jgi:hypothetical protein